MPRKKQAPERRSGCPLNASVEMLGDRWSLLIIRDMMLLGRRTFNEFLDSYERPATKILTDRLRKLETYGIIRTDHDPADGRRSIYLLTPKGMDLAPVLTEMVVWAGKHEKTENRPLIRLMQKDKEEFLKKIRERWAQQGVGPRT